MPVLLNLQSKEFAVRVPSVHELENDYAVYDELDEMLGAVGEGRRHLVEFARRLSQVCSREFGKEISTGNMPVSGIRRLVEDYIRAAMAQQKTVSSVTRPRMTNASPASSMVVTTELTKAFSSY